jgi:hypothetical protein
MYDAPPFSPAIYGKRHMFPNPTAEPAVARISPNVFLKFALSDISYLVLPAKLIKKNKICYSLWIFIANFA